MNLQTGFDIKVYDDLYDKELVNAWKLLQKESDVYPQVYYEWIEPWWRFKKGNKKLYIITVVNSDKIVGIAPFCIEKKYGLKILTIIPIHFSDFYEFILKKDFEDIIVQKIIDHCLSYKKWQFVFLDKINSSYSIFGKISDNSFLCEKRSDIIKTNLNFENFEEFLDDIPRRQRGDYNRRIRRFKEQGELDFIVLQTPEQYKFYENSMKDITQKRWGESESGIKSIFEHRYFAFCNLLSIGNAIGFLLLFNNELVAFSLGFIRDDTYYNFKLVYDPEFSKYGVGNLVTGMAIEYLIDENIHEFNHGGGEYRYKEKWFNNRIESANYSFFLKNNNFILTLYLRSVLKMKSLIKKILKR